MSIFVKDSGLKVAFRLEAADGFVEYGGDVQEFVEALALAGKVSPKHAYMLKVWKKNGALSIKTSNKFAKKLRSIAKKPMVQEVSIEQVMAEAEAENAKRSQEQSIEDAMREAEQRNAEMDALTIALASMPEKRSKAIKAELARWGCKV